MPRDRRNAGPCPQCAAGEVACTYNRFDNGPERIESWEHRCLSCSYRETKAMRSAEGQPVEGDPKTCPFCGRKADPAV
jgi:ssDNA-binding Zn-finger/Zn-ribbon topoisomerase 1